MKARAGETPGWQDMLVTFNGKELPLVIEADEEGGTVTFYAEPGVTYEDSHSSWTLTGRHHQPLTLHGNVVILRRP